jgi:hypothetical protein
VPRAPKNSRTAIINLRLRKIRSFFLESTSQSLLKDECALILRILARQIPPRLTEICLDGLRFMRLWARGQVDSFFTKRNQTGIKERTVLHQRQSAEDLVCLIRLTADWDIVRNSIAHRFCKRACENKSLSLSLYLYRPGLMSLDGLGLQIWQRNASIRAPVNNTAEWTTTHSPNAARASKQTR